MALERRERGTIYYYRRVPADGGKRRKEYVGAGRLAVIAARRDEMIRAERQAEADKRRAELTAFAAGEASIDDLCQRTERLVQATLLGAGFRRHDRGKWRRRRERDDVAH
jgi:hypothetical protein